MKRSRQEQVREFERIAKLAKSDNRAERNDAVGLLTPNLIRKHIRSGRDLVLAYGRKGATVTYTPADLKRFADAAEKSDKDFRGDTRGVPLLQLENNSTPQDMSRSREIKNATLYKVAGNVLSFRVSASQNSAKSHHQVIVRLEEWGSLIRSPSMAPLLSAKSAATGRLSFDCSCGRHQFWYRYLANIGGFDLGDMKGVPREQDFPKIRNPQLRGCCCKHVLKVLRTLKSNVIHTVLAKEVERQSSTVGYADKVKAKILSEDNLKRTQRAKGTLKTTKEARAAYRKFKQELAEFIEKARADKNVQEMKKGLKPRKKDAAKPEPQKPVNKREGRGELILLIQDTLRMAKSYKIDPKPLLAGVSQSKGIPVEQIEKIIAEEKLS